jgi:outer membrane lipoprotein SlyB
VNLGGSDISERDGTNVGTFVGVTVGRNVGERVGTAVGAGVGASEENAMRTASTFFRIPSTFPVLSSPI